MVILFKYFVLLAHGPRDDVDVGAEEQLYLVYAAASDDELQPVVVFAV